MPENCVSNNILYCPISTSAACKTFYLIYPYSIGSTINMCLDLIKIQGVAPHIFGF